MADRVHLFAKLAERRNLGADSPYYGETVGIIFDLPKLFKHPLRSDVIHSSEIHVQNLDYGGQ